MTDESPTVFIIDDDPSARKGLSRLVRTAGMRVEAYDSALEFLERKHYDGYGCILLDVKMPGLSGMELQEELGKADYSLPIIFVSGHGDVPTAAQAMKKGAVDFLTKPVDKDQLLEAINRSLAMDRENRKALSDKAKVCERLAALTPREYEIMTFVIAGMLNKQIAYELEIAEDTIKIHRGRMMRKMKVESVAELVRLTEIAGIKPAKAGSQ
ncbi:MAG: response regulator transcription factor [Phycisphaerales bacterium]|nr:MAG: response regulator transcription factor [Phycisphaerales bacterium]